jgi:uncharacterized protein YabE (DUF348 family)
MRTISYKIFQHGDRRFRLELRKLWVYLAILFVLVGVFTYVIALDHVTIIVDGEELAGKTLAATVDQALRDFDVKLKPGDEVEPQLNRGVREKTVIKVSRAVPISVLADGHVVALNTVPVTVGETLKRAKIDLGSEDKVSYDLNATIQDGMEIRVVRVTSQVKTEEVVIKPPVSYVKDNKLEKGVRKVVQEGKPGRVRRTLKITSEDGQVTQKKIITSTVLSPAVKKVVAIGAKPAIYSLTTSRGRTIRYTKSKIMNATAYYPGPESCGVFADGYTATGDKAGFGIVAVDRRKIPLGTMLYIEGYGIAKAADVGSAIKGNRIDLCFDTYREAKMFGRKNVKVYFLAP